MSDTATEPTFMPTTEQNLDAQLTFVSGIVRKAGKFSVSVNRDAVYSGENENGTAMYEPGSETVITIRLRNS